MSGRAAKQARHRRNVARRPLHPVLHEAIEHQPQLHCHPARCVLPDPFLKWRGIVAGVFNGFAQDFGPDRGIAGAGERVWPNHVDDAMGQRLGRSFTLKERLGGNLATSRASTIDTPLLPTGNG
jgi:hypothetical protein